MSSESQTKPMTILLVEDHQDTREAMQNWLKRRGYAVLQANDIKSALDVGRKTPFDLLICDVQLPDGDGRQLLQQLEAEAVIIGLAMSGQCGRMWRAAKGPASSLI